MTYRRNREKYGVHISPQALDGWRFGVASGKPRVRILSDSQAFGQIINTPTNTNGDVWRTKLRDQLVAWSAIGTLAAEYHPIIYTSALATALGVTWAGNAPWVQEVLPFPLATPNMEGSTWTIISYSWQLGLGSVAAWLSATNGTTVMTFNKTNWLPAFVDADIWMPKETAASPPGTYKIDGAAAVGLTNVTVADHQMSSTLLTGMSNTSHKIEIVGNGATLWMDGITAWYAGRSGNGLQWATSGFPFGDLSNYGPYVWENLAGYTTAGNYGTLGFPMVPHLLIIHHGLNDSKRVSPSTFCTRLMGIVRCMRRAAEIQYGSGFKMSVLVVVEDSPDTGVYQLVAGPGDSGAHGNNIWVQASWLEWQQAVEEVVECLDGVMVNWCQISNARPLAKGYLIANDAHLTVAGHQALADLLASVLIL